MKTFKTLMIKSFVLFLFGFIFLSALYLLGNPVLATGENISSGTTGYIDTHNHINGKFGPPLRPKLDYDGAVQTALSKMDRLGIKKMFVMPPPFTPSNKRIYEIDEFIDAVKKYPDRFAYLGGGGTLNVMIQQAVQAGQTSSKLKDKFKKKALELLSKGAIGFGELSAEHLALGKKHHHQSAPPNHPLFLLLADIAAEKNVPIDIHMEAVPEKMPLPSRLNSFSNPKELSPNIAAFEKLLTHNKKAKIIWAHVGWDNTGHRTTKLIANLMEKHPNLYMSFKICREDSISKNRPMERGVGLKQEWLEVMRKFPDRFMIGSDQFYLSPRMRGRVGPPSFGSTNKFFTLLPPDLARKIGYENAIRLFNLPK